MTETAASRNCAECATDAPPGLLGWSTQDEGGVRSVLCPACTRTYARSIEAKLDQRWW